MKKKMILLAISLIAVLPGISQTRYHKRYHHPLATKAPVIVMPPAAVQTAFTQHFADVTGEKWNKMASGGWIAAFMQDSLKMNTQFDSSGNWIATHTLYTADNIPTNIAGDIKVKYPNVAILDAIRVERNDVAAYYMVDVNDQGTTMSLLANDQGIVTE